MKKYQPYALMLIAGLIYSLGHPNLLGVLLPFTPILGTSLLIYFIIKAPSPWSAIKYLLTFNLVITIVSFYWITNTLQEFGNLPFVVAGLFNLCYALIFCPQYWFLILGLALIKKYKRRWFNLYFRDGLFSILLAATLTTLEYFIPQQFPIMLGQPWIVFSDYLGLAPYFGLPLFSFLSYIVAIEIIRYFKVRRISYFNFSVVFILIGLNIQLASRPVTSAQEASDNKLTPFKVRVVQANISNFLKVDSETGNYASVDQVLSSYKELSLLPSKEQKKIDLIIWPETAYPYPITTDKKDLGQTVLPPLFLEIATLMDSELLIGGYDHLKDDTDNSFYQTEYNAAFHISANGQLKKTFHKHILIPFGETLPFGPLNKWISKQVPELAFFAEGSSFPTFTTASGINFITTICYELIKPEFIRKYLNETDKHPQVLINLSNDSWYGNTVEPEQHLFLAKWRAIEFNLPIIRSTNTGISSYIGSDGIEKQRLNYYKKGNLDLELMIGPAPAPTMYQKYGYMMILPLFALCFIFHLLLIKFKYAKNNSHL
ncbi:MAG: apolipoprotein N-acyltransferase [Halobacteriovoraceae bacterium]|nr:apolipoprotein N-acyltransferase [Halobacteriovoraceae bacterium]|tara:strand:+ start:2109 stop:3740 length:1632 start_codon:yes stop_codon:yes gene_type:complete